MLSSRLGLALAGGLFFVSGAGALVIETVWMRWLRLLLGATAPAASATLVAFFAGQALGAALGGRLAARWRQPLRAYAALEVLAAGAAASVPLLLGGLEAAFDPLYDSLRQWPGGLTAARFAMALAATLPAATAFGATLPTLATAVVGPIGRLGSRGALLYGLNTLGAALGVAAASFWLLDVASVTATYASGIGCLLLAGAGALGLSLVSAARAPAVEQRAPRPTLAFSPRGLLLLAALSGLGSFAAQVLLIHGFGLVLNQSTYAFGSVLVVVLTTLGGGALLMASLSRRGRPDPRTMLAGTLLAAGLGLAIFPTLFAWATDGLSYLGSQRPWPAYLWRSLALCALTAGPALLAAGLVFPALLAVSARMAGRSGAGARMGQLVATNTLGALAGALIAPYVLLPALGPWLGLGVVAGLYALAALAVPFPGRGTRRVLAVAWVLGALAVGIFALPSQVPLVRLEPGETLVHLESTPAGTVAVLERDGGRLIQIDNHYTLGGQADKIHQERQGHVPLLLRPEAKRVAFLGSGTGSSAAAALAHGAERITLVELVPGVAAAAARFFEADNRGIYRDPRSEVVLDDARNFLRATSERFDVIVGDLFVPWRSGAAALFAREHFQVARQRLTENGLMCQWLPLYQMSEAEFLVIAATFLDVFPHSALFRGDFFGSHPIVALVGWKSTPAPALDVSAGVERLSRAGVDDRWVTDPLGFWSLYLGPISGLEPALADLPRNRDDHPVLEFQAARSHSGGTRGVTDPFVGLSFVAFADQVRAAARRHGDPLFPGLSEPERLASQGGHALQLAGALFAAGRTAASGRALADASRWIPPRLLADAAADPTAAEVWHTEP